MPRAWRVKQLPESFFEAIEESDSATMTRYLSDGIDLNGRRGYRTTYCTPLTVAVDSQNFNTVTMMIAYGAKVDMPGTAWGTTPLQVAVRHGRLDIVKVLVDSGADVNVLDRCKVSPLTVACETGNVEVARYLLSQGACVNHQAGCEVLPLPLRKTLNADEDLTYEQREDLLDPFKGNTPLTKAAWSGNVDLVRELLLKGSDVNATTHAGNTALHIAAREGHVDIVRLLIGHSVSFELKNEKGETAAFTAVRKFFDRATPCGDTHVKIVEELLQNGCDVASKNSSNQNLMFVILTSNFQRVTENGEALRIRLLRKVLAATRSLSYLDLPDESNVSLQLRNTFGNPVPQLITMAKSARSLQHLCRLCVWDVLSPNSTKIQDLPVTAIMKAYLTMS